MALPAPYAPPWKRLGEDLVAVLAWLGLKVRELWRRNREGSLPAPPFWPRAWVKLFWPLALTTVLVAVLVAALALVRPWMVPSPAPPPAGEIPPQEPRAARPEPSAEILEGAEEMPQPPPGPTQPEEGEREMDLKPQAPQLEETAPVEIPTPTLPDAGEPEADLLEEAWRADDPEGLIVARRTEPDSATLRLELKDGFGGLSLAKRQRWAERWQARATELGYSHLELWNGQRQLLGRGALVGRGMILLRPSQSERHSP